MKTLIPAYEKGWKAYGSSNEEFIRRSTWSKGPEDVKRQLLDYIKEYVDDLEVEGFIWSLANNEELLAKSSVISDGSYRTVVCSLSATSYYIRGLGDLEKNCPGVSVSKEEWNDFAMENSEEFFIRFDYQKTRKRLHGVYEPNIFEGDSYTAEYIKKWCEHHKGMFESGSIGAANLLYSKIWGEHAGDVFPPNPKVYYFTEWDYRRGCYKLRRDTEKSPRRA